MVRRNRSPLPQSFLEPLSRQDASLANQIARGWLAFQLGRGWVPEAENPTEVILLQLLVALVGLTAQKPFAQQLFLHRLQLFQSQTSALDFRGHELREAGLLWARAELGLALQHLVRLAGQEPDGLLTLKIIEWLADLRAQESQGSLLLDASLGFLLHHGEDPDFSEFMLLL